MFEFDSLVFEYSVYDTIAIPINNIEIIYDE